MEQDQAKGDKPYRVKEWAAKADLSTSKVYVMIRRGELQAIRYGGAIRIPRQVGDRALRGDAAA